jgi:PAT family beta-lactamase induction signal transducer AmpG
LARTQTVPPAWVLGFGFWPLGAFGALQLLTVPQLLAADRVPEPQIAAVTAISLLPGFGAFVLAPILDWRLSRRAYAVGFSLLAALCMAAALASIRDLPMLTILLFIGNTAIALCVSAVGGWFGSITRKEGEGALGAWFTVANIGAAGLVGASGIHFLRGLPPALGAGAAGLMVLAALPLYLWVPCPPADDRLAHESFRAFARDVAALLRRPAVVWTLLLFLAPAAAFALTNIMGGVGRDFHVSESFVGLISGVGVTLAGVFGSLMIPVLSRGVAPRPLYLLVGGAGAVFSAALVLAPHIPATFALAVIGENIFQAASFSVQNLIILRTIGQNNPLAATQFGVLNAAGSLPLSYMQYADGQGYGVGGIGGAYLADALISGGACAALALMLVLLRPRIPAI